MGLIVSLGDLNVIEQSGLKEKLKHRYDRVEVRYDSDLRPNLSLILEFGYVISIKGLGHWSFGKKEFYFLGDVSNNIEKYNLEILKNYINCIKEGDENYEITIYICPTRLEECKNKNLESKEYVIDDFTDKIFRYFDVELDKSKIKVDYSGINK